MGHVQTLAAFEQLWAEGVDANLVIIGWQGWNVEKLVEPMCNLPERGSRLFWLEGISDEYLEKVYDASTCLIAASEGEGFGLPLIEAAQQSCQSSPGTFPYSARLPGSMVTISAAKSRLILQWRYENGLR